MAFSVDDEFDSWAETFINTVQADEDYQDGKLFGKYKENISREDFAYVGVEVYEAIYDTKCVVGDAVLQTLQILGF